jgi:predicted ATPase
MPADRHDACLIERVVLRNYKSIAACDVRLGPLTFLVGANGSGKSNFLDALRFVADALRDSLNFALRTRGGIDGVRRRGAEVLPIFGMRLEFRLPDGATGHLAFQIGGASTATVVFAEECFVSGPGYHEYYVVREGAVIESSLPLAPQGVENRLYLVNASGIPGLKPVFDGLSSMAFYNLNPERMRELLPPDAGEYLTRDGANLPSILAKLTSENRQVKARIEKYLEQVVPGFTGVNTVPIAGRETLAFQQQLGGGTRSRWFTADSMSDGTLRALGILVALFQGQDEISRPLLVGLEEPETALHPAATEVLLDSFREATEFRQVLVTSHSPDLLDNESILDSEILAVVAEDGKSSLGPLDQIGRSVLRDHLYTAGQLLRMHQLRPSAEAVGLEPDEVSLFGVEESADP